MQLLLSIPILNANANETQLPIPILIPTSISILTQMPIPSPRPISMFIRKCNTNDITSTDINISTSSYIPKPMPILMPVPMPLPITLTIPISITLPYTKLIIQIATITLNRLLLVNASDTNNYLWLRYSWNIFFGHSRMFVVLSRWPCYRESIRHLLIIYYDVWYPYLCCFDLYPLNVSIVTRVPCYKRIMPCL